MARLFRTFLAIAFAAALHGAGAGTLGPDGVAGRALPGKFVWFDLATEDPAAARAFYGAVFGWKFRAVDGAPAGYTLIENASGKVGGLFRHARPPGGKSGARWLSLISVADAARTAQLVKERGGQVLLAPKAVPGRGVHAVFRDDQGAVFGALASESGDPADTPVDDGDVFWLDLFTPNVAKSAAFYAAVAGFEVSVGEVAGRQRTLLASQDIARAGIALLPAGSDRPGWLPYILVGDVRETLRRARAAGGAILMEPRRDVLDGNVAVIADPQGGVIGVVNWTEAAR